MKESKRQKIEELIKIVEVLNERDQERLIWISEGLLMSRELANGK